LLRFVALFAADQVMSMVAVTIGGPAPAEMALTGLRVLDLSHGVPGPFAARLLGDLGADVVKVEQPGIGDFARTIEPLHPAAPAPESGLLFQYLNWNKRSVTLDLRNSAAHPALRALVERSDIVIEAFKPGTLDGWGIPVERFFEWNPNVVVTSVSNFGQTGPYADWDATDLTIHAMSGIMQISGRVDRDPLKHGLRQALFCAGLNAAYATLAARLAVLATGGPGEHVDLSILECIASEHTGNQPYYAFMGAIQGRRAIVQDPFAGEPIPTADGYLSLQFGGGAPFTDFADFLGIPELRDRFATVGGRVRAAEEVREKIEAAVADKVAKEVFLEGAQRRLLTGFVQTAADLLVCPHLEAREFWAEIEHPETGKFRFPGELVRLSRTPLSIRRRPPLLGEHNHEVLVGALGLDATTVDAATSPFRPETPLPARPRPAASPRQKRATLPLEGLRVLDLSTVLAIPYCGGILSDLGAEVIKIEAPNRLDQTRQQDWLQPEVGPSDEPWNRSGGFHVVNRGKRSFVINLAEPEGREVFKKLVAKSDIIINNFTPRVLPGWGLDYEHLAEIRPDIILLSNCGYGATGPWAPFPVQGTVLENTMGITAYTGYRGDKPWKVGQSYPDFITCWTALTSLLAAVIERKRTGRGQAIDLSMYQVGVSLVPEAILHHQAYGTELDRIGNEDRVDVPGNLYPAKGDDRWVALSVTSDEAFAGFARVIGRPELAHDARFATVAARQAHRDELNALAAEWAAGQDRWDAALALQAAGVAAAPMLDARDLALDPHLKERGFYEYVEHWQPMGIRPIIGRPYRFANTDLRIRRPGPRYGADNRYVLSDVMGLSDDEIAALYAAGLTSDAPAFEVTNQPVDLEPALRNGSMKEVDPHYRERLGLPPLAVSEASASSAS